MEERQTRREAANSNELVAAADGLRKDGYRLVQACVAGKDKFHLLYSFARGDELVNLVFRAREDEEVESISGIYPYAYLYENEMRDLFGVRIRRINVDFGGKLYSTAVAAPFAAGGETQKSG